jgi:hypothetical protein
VSVDTRLAETPVTVDAGSAPAATAAPADIEFTDTAATQNLARELRDADFGRLKAVLAQTRADLDFNTHAITQLRRTVEKTPPRDRTEFDSASAQVRVREVALRHSIAAASTAAPDKAADAQAQVARDYEAYARAVAVAEAVAQKFRGAANVASNR